MLKHVSVGVMLIVTGCAAHSSQIIAPALVTYTPAEQQRLRAELTATPDHPETQRWLRDYVGLRDQVRALNREN